MRFNRANCGAAIIDAGEPSIGSVCERSAPKVIIRDETNNPRVDNSPNTMTAKIKRQYEKLHAIREQMLDGFLELNPKQFMKEIAVKKPEAALAFIGRLLPRDLDTPVAANDRQPILIIQTNNAQVNIEK